jgi:predicted transcriptional regulator
MASLRSLRNTLGISQSSLARISGVSRFKICMYEIGDGTLTVDEHRRIKIALETEAARLQRVAEGMVLSEIEPDGTNV